MQDGLRSRMLRLLRVPAEPAPPPGDPAEVRTFRAAPRYFAYRATAWSLKQAGAVLGLAFSYFIIGLPGWFGYYARVVEQIFIAGFLLQLPFSFALLRLDFDLRWYMLSDRSLRIRHGILKITEQTITFANVQNIAIRQNPLQRLFGISTVAVRAAGGGGRSDEHGLASSTHEATFEGVDDPESIRDLIRERVRAFRDSGLGDPDEPARALAARTGGGAAGVPPGELGAANRAARTLLEEVRLLNASVRAD